MRTLGLLFVFALFLAPSALARTEGLTLKVSHVLEPESHYHRGLLELDRLLRESSGGRMGLSIYHSAQLGSEKDAVEAVLMGTVEMTLVSSAPLSAYTDAFLVFDLPFVVRDRERLYAWLDGHHGRALLDSLRSFNLVGLGFWENGFRHLTNSRRPVARPEDLSGLKIRVMENPIHAATFRLFGAHPVPMPFGDLAFALKVGTVDGQENPLVIIYTSRFYESQRYLTLTGHFYSPAVLLASGSLWERKLTEEERRLIRSCEAKARAWERDFSRRTEEEVLSRLKERGMEVIAPDREVWMEACGPIYSQFEEKVGRTLLEVFLSSQSLSRSDGKISQ